MVVLGVCGGNGVILHPFKEYLLANIEPRGIFHTPGDIQWKLNFGQIPMLKTLPNIPGRVTVIVGAPDCGHSSILSYSRAKKLSDPKENKSLNVYIEAVKKYQPDIFLMENLPKLLNGIDLNKTFPGYQIITRVLPMSRFGNSQKSRVRLIIIGCKYKKAWEFPNYWTRLKTVGQLLAGLGGKNKPEICHVRESDDSYIPLYTKNARKIKVSEARKIWNTKFKYQTRWSVPNSKMVNQPGVYKLRYNESPLTVRKQNRQFNPDGFMLSPREIARIQGIPDSFHLWYDKTRHLYCINKARATCAKTPPYEVGEWFMEELNKGIL